MVSRSRAGERLDRVHPGLLGFTDLVFSDGAAVPAAGAVNVATPVALVVAVEVELPFRTDTETPVSAAPDA